VLQLVAQLSKPAVSRVSKPAIGRFKNDIVSSFQFAVARTKQSVRGHALPRRQGILLSDLKARCISIDHYLELHPDTTTGTPDLSGSPSATRPPAD
jgi:hypothetical protein